MINKKTNPPRQRPGTGRKEPPRRKNGPIVPGGDPDFPLPDIDPFPDDILGGAFRKLDPGLPLLLLPIRIETRYHLQADPPELRIRIYPDQIHIDADRPQLSPNEVNLTKEFWRRWYTVKDEAGKKAAWQRFVGNVGSKRAGYLARTLRPTREKDGSLTFPPLPATSTKPAPAHPALMPHRWLAIGYGVGGSQIFRETSRPVKRNLRTGPDPEAPSWEVSDGSLALDEGLAWMIDYEQAVQAGMAITVPLTGFASQATDRVTVLLVVGLVEELDPQDASAELSRLLDVHTRTTGLAFVPQGTPTNNTESVSSGWAPEEAELAALAEQSLKDPPVDRRPILDDNAAQLSRALGLADAGFLRRVAFGTDRELTHAQQMRTVLFEAVFGTFLRQLLDVGSKNGLSLDAINAMRSWFIEHVTGGAPVPTLRIGPQPYGILPVRRMETQPDRTTTAGQVEWVIHQLIDIWRESIGQLPSLAEDPGDDTLETGIETAIAMILAAQPHPARLFLRDTEEYIEDSTPFAIQITYNFLLDQISDPDSPVVLTAIGDVYQDFLSEDYPGGFDSIDDQITLWTAVQERVSQSFSSEVREYAVNYVGYILNVLNSYEGRQRPLRWLGLDNYEGVLGEKNTTLVAAALRGDGVEWGDAGLIQAADAGPGHTAADYLNDLKSRLQAGTLEPANWSPKPLLYQLIELTLSLLPNNPAARQKVVNALDGLAGLDPEVLEWLLRETLGLGSHRLDAWATSLASERLNRMRQKAPAGIQIGAFGWVISLEPRRQKRPSDGFSHTPSMAHAATAAILRAGWHAHGSQDPLSPVAVNISSDRVRAASWLLDGVRQGQPLGELLGYHFERSLHDRNADDQIREVRQQVLTAQGRPNAAPDQPVDGIELLDLYRSSQLDKLTKPAQDAIADLTAAFDAVNDVGLFEAVHQLAGGSYERATAVMDSISMGTIAPPELRAPLTPRSAVSVEHRVVILLDPDSPRLERGWKDGVRDRIAPPLENWAASLLPPAGAIGFVAAEINASGQPGLAVPLTLAELNLSALDAIFISGDDPLAGTAALRTLAAAAAGIEGAVQIDPTVSHTDVSLADFIVLATELRRLIEALRPLDARDLRPASTRGEADTNLNPALREIETLIADFETQSASLDAALNGAGPKKLASLAIQFAKCGSSSGLAPRDLTGAAQLKSMLDRRRANIAALKVDPADRQPGLEARLAALLGGSVPALGIFTLAGSAGGSVVDVTAEPASAVEIDDWVDAVSRVRADVGSLFAVGLLSELIGAGGLACQVGQDPLLPGEGWAAAHRPAGAGRLSILAVSGPGGAPAAGQPACGLLVDQWSEAIPADEQVSGLTFQYDAPSNRPPQAWLLAVPPDGALWSLNLITDTLLQTLDWSMMRAVGPEDLVDYGRAIPTTFVPGNIARWIGENE